MRALWRELDKLAIFISVAEKGKINEAAHVLHLTQPSITRAIQKLEQAFGAPLLSRGREGVKLTPAGRLLYEYGHRALRQLDDIQQQAQFTDDPLAGRLTIGTYESLAEYLWPDFLSDLGKSHPQLQLSVKTSLQHDPLADLVDGKIDLLVDAEPPIRDNVVSWPIYADKFAFFSSPRLAANEYDQKASRDLSVIFCTSVFDHEHLSLEDHLERAGYRFARKFAFDSFATAKQLALRGIGIATLPLRLAQADVTSRRLKRVSLKGFATEGFGKHTICASVSREREKDVRLRKVISLLKKHLKDEVR